MNIGIVGAGPTGLTAALELLARNNKVVVFEKSPEYLGGLTGAVTIGQTYIDRYYHHIFTSDSEVLNLIGELGLSDDMLWREPKNGIYLNGTLHPFTSPMDLIMFPAISFIGRMRMGFAVLNAKKVKDYKSMESISAKDWLIEKTGRDPYEKIWRTLLYSKFDRDADLVSGVWIWNKFKLRGSTRSNLNKEMLGYLKGSFYKLYQTMETKILSAEGKILYEPVIHISQHVGGKVAIESKFGELVFDKIIFTGSPNEMCRITEMPNEYLERVSRTKYKANICMTLIVKHRVSDYYWVTVAERDAPFVLYIEHTNLINDPDYNDSHIIYLSRYLDAADSFFEASDEEIREIFLDYMSRMFVSFRKDTIINSYISRSLYTQPVIGLHYSHHILPFDTPLKNLYLASMAQVYPEDRGQNYAIAMGKKIADHISMNGG
jgi:protoporphyrinogen oxidase